MILVLFVLLVLLRLGLIELFDVIFCEEFKLDWFFIRGYVIFKELEEFCFSVMLVWVDGWIIFAGLIAWDYEDLF